VERSQNWGNAIPIYGSSEYSGHNILDQLKDLQGIIWTKKNSHKPLQLFGSEAAFVKACDLWLQIPGD